MDISNDFINYPENQFKGRMKLIYNWIDNCNILLDGGCAHDYGTILFNKKCKETYGIDLNNDSIYIAKKRYPQINFLKCSIEQTSFSNEFFDTVIASEILEHTKSDVETLNEIFRILKPNGQLIITVPHKGLFSFMDTLNYMYYFNKYVPLLYNCIIYFAENRFKKKISNIENKHKHYSIEDIVNVLNDSKFNDNYKIVEIFRSGLFLGVFVNNLQIIMNLIFGKKLTSIILKPLFYFKEKDYWIQYGKLSYYLSIKIIKIKNI